MCIQIDVEHLPDVPERGSSRSASTPPLITAADPATLLSMSSPSLRLRGEDSAQNNMSHSKCEGMLEVTRLGESGPESWVRESPASQPRGRHVRGEPDPRPGDSAARKEAIQLVGEVALKDPDDVPLGPALLQSTFEPHYLHVVIRLTSLSLVEGHHCLSLATQAKGRRSNPKTE